MSYSDHFSSEESAVSYDAVQYAAGSYSSLLWAIEKEQLDQVWATHSIPPDAAVLDFACGTGRVLEYLSKKTTDITGIEVSRQMAERARSRVPSAQVLCGDITQEDIVPQDSYDVITAFRFFLNAEPLLRRSAMAALRVMLRPGGLLILNNHGNLYSHKALLAPLHHLSRRGRAERSGNYLRQSELVDVAARAGLRIDRVAGCGLLGGRTYRHFRGARIDALEKRLSVSSFARFGSNQLYVARAS
ncbi:MAG: class I SAM-dependent methyltransferase [Actinomycetota bacterium]|nr:class I SAM-dependent methyltransferase [Actinomycetota bacterium]